MLGLNSMLARRTQGLRRRVLATRLWCVELERERIERLPPPADRESALARTHRLEVLAVRSVQLRYLAARLLASAPRRARLARMPGRSAR